MMVTTQIIWALIGLFFGLLLAVPHSWFPTRTVGTQGTFICVVVASLLGMKGGFQAAYLLVAIAAVIFMVSVIQHAMLAAGQPRQIPVKQKGRHL